MLKVIPDTDFHYVECDRCGADGGFIEPWKHDALVAAGDCGWTTDGQDGNGRYHCPGCPPLGPLVLRLPGVSMICLYNQHLLCDGTTLRFAGCRCPCHDDAPGGDGGAEVR